MATIPRGDMRAMALVYDASVKLGKRAVIDAIAATLDSLEDPLDRIWIEDTSAKRRTYTVSEALAVLGQQAGFRYLWAAPVSERGNSRFNWLSAVMVDNIAVNSSTLFFALPRGLVKDFGPHVTLLELLVQAHVIPQYGWAYMCQYDKPDFFAFDYAYNHRVNLLEQAQWQPLCISNHDRVGHPVDHPDRRRRAGGSILDVFPMNVLSDMHLRQKIGDSSFKEWILENTGSESLTQIGPGCFTWRVPAARTTAIAAQLRQFGLILRDPVMTVSRNCPSGIGATTSGRSSPLDRRRWPGPASEPTSQRSALPALSPSVYAAPTRCNLTPTRSYNRTAPTADGPIPQPPPDDAPAATGGASLVLPSRRPGSC